MPSEEDCECALCHELMVQPVVLPCSHVFCRHCLAACLQSGPASRRCPLCRRLLHATTVEDLAVCSLLSSFLEEKFLEEYQKRHEIAKESSMPELRPSGETQELPLFVLDAMLPLQRLHLNVFEPRYCALVRRALASGRRFGMVGFDREMSFLQQGVEVVIEDCMQAPNGHFQVRIVGTRVFQCLEASQHADGYYLATVSFPTMELSEEDAAAFEEEVQQMLTDLQDWQALVRAERPQQLDSILRDLGPRPPATQLGALMLWVAALLNPLPPLGLAFELRPQVLAAQDAAARLGVVRQGLENSLAHLRLLSKSPLRRWCLYLFRLPAPVMMTSVMVFACLVSAIFPGAK
eukprot:s1291_g12.t1